MPGLNKLAGGSGKQQAQLLGGRGRHRSSSLPCLLLPSVHGQPDGVGVCRHKVAARRAQGADATRRLRNPRRSTNRPQQGGATPPLLLLLLLSQRVDQRVPAADQRYFEARPVGGGGRECGARSQSGRGDLCGCRRRGSGHQNRGGGREPGAGSRSALLSRPALYRLHPFTCTDSPPLPSPHLHLHSRSAPPP